MKSVTLYTKSYCPYCHKAKALLSSKGVKFKEIDYGALGDSEKEKLFEKTDGYMSVPQIFIGDVFVGGSDDLHALEKSGKLDEMLK